MRPERKMCISLFGGITICFCISNRRQTWRGCGANGASAHLSCCRSPVRQLQSDASRTSLLPVHSRPKRVLRLVFRSNIVNRLKALAILALERMNLINININMILFDLIRNNIKENFVCVQNLYMDFADLRAIKEIVPIRSRLEI